MTLPKRLGRKTLLELKAVNFHEDRVLMPNGNTIDPFYFLEIAFSAVAAIVQRENGDLLLERVARYPTQAVTWELPIGIIEADESMLQAAQREVLEETGYSTEGHEHIYSYHPMSGISNVEVHVVSCKGLEQIGQIDKNEVESIRWFSQEDISKLIAQGELSDGFSLTGLLLYLNKLDS